jgi:hypothetical protein
MTQPPQLDIVSVLTAVAALLFAPELAAMVGPYAVILIGATLGAAWGATRRPASSRIGTLGYIAGMVALACLVTVPAAAAGSKLTGLHLHWLLGPVAALIGALGPEWAYNKARSFLSAASKGGSQ